MSFEVDENLFRAYYRAIAKGNPKFVEGCTEDEAVAQAKKTAKDLETAAKLVVNAAYGEAGRKRQSR